MIERRGREKVMAFVIAGGEGARLRRPLTLDPLQVGGAVRKPLPHYRFRMAWTVSALFSEQL